MVDSQLTKVVVFVILANKRVETLSSIQPISLSNIFCLKEDIKTFLIESVNFNKSRYTNTSSGMEYSFPKNLTVKLLMDMATEINQQVGKFISKLCDKGIYNRTVNDYLRNNKGYELFSQTNKAAFEKTKAILIDKLDTLKSGVEDALYRKDASVTGMGFSIWSGSFVNHAIYAAMEASTIRDQEKAANAQYQKDVDNLFAKMDADEASAKRDYLYNVYIPNMEVALTVFAYELLDKYISDLIASDNFDKRALEFIDISRSNELLDNLNLSNNKNVILENAFAACPYNVSVYMQAMKLDSLDYESFKTAKVFKQDDEIVSFLKDNLGNSPKLEKRKIHFRTAELLSLYTNTPLRKVTAYMADYIVNGYSQTIAALLNKAQCRNIMSKVAEEDILAGDRVTKEKVDWLVDPLAPTMLWNKLTAEYGHEDLFERLLRLLPDNVNVGSKQEYDAYLKDKLFSVLESVRLELAEEITERKREEQKQRELEAEKARIAAEKRKKFIKYGVIIGSFVLVAIITISLITSYFSTISNIEEYISDQQYEHAFDAVNSSNLSKKKKQEYRDVLIPLMQENISANIERYQVINADEYKVYLENNEIIVRDKSGEGLLYCNGGGTKILDEILYANGYIFFVEASDNWGYDVKYISIENGGERHIDTFDEFDRLIKLDDGRIFIDSLNSDDRYVMFDPYKLTSKAIAPSSVDSQVNVVYDTNTYGYKKDDNTMSVPQVFSNCVVGDVIKLGRYEQDGNTRNGKEPIDWIVLKIQDGKAFLVSKYALDAHEYNRGYSQDSDWEDCWLREWLNDDFLTAAFNSEELSIISGTQDKVFLLSVDEAKKYFSSDTDRQCKLTEYAEEQGASPIDGYCWWWLQSTENAATVVGCKGDICDYGNYVHIKSDEYAVRPAMWIEVNQHEGDESKIVSVRGLKAAVSPNWKVYNQVSENLGRASIGSNNEYRSWYISYEGKYDSFAEFVKDKPDEVYEADDSSDYSDWDVEDCTEGYIYIGNIDGELVVDFYVVCKGHVLNLTYSSRTGNEHDSKAEAEALLSSVDFANFVFR